MSKRENPEINAGSMADIAFLLLIFFLVTTTMDVDKGIIRKIPDRNEDAIDINKKNILDINLNKDNQLFVNGDIIEISQLKEIAQKFIDNGGGLSIDKKPCDWCKGERKENSSEHPTKAVISISSDRNTSYENYINTLDNINQAYHSLRNRLAKELYNTSYNSLEKTLNTKSDNANIIEKVKTIRNKYPKLIFDTETY